MDEAANVSKTLVPQTKQQPYFYSTEIKPFDRFPSFFSTHRSSSRPRFSQGKAEGPFPWSYNVRTDLLHPNALRTSSIRNTAPRMKYSIETDDSWLDSQFLQKLSKPRSHQSLKVPIEPLKDLTFSKKVRFGDCIKYDIKQFPGPGSYDLTKYSCIGDKTIPPTLSRVT